MEGLQILAFPCNQFGEQEPGSPKDIFEFAMGYGLTLDSSMESRFHLMEKSDVNGENAHPVWKYLKKITNSGNIEWNFATKFVIHCDEENCNISRHDDVSSLKALKQAKPPKLSFKKTTSGEMEHIVELSHDEL